MPACSVFDDSLKERHVGICPPNEPPLGVAAFRIDGNEPFAIGELGEPGNLLLLRGIGIKAMQGHDQWRRGCAESCRQVQPIRPGFTANLKQYDFSTLNSWRRGLGLLTVANPVPDAILRRGWCRRETHQHRCEQDNGPTLLERLKHGDDIAPI
jgi:hypothetical protein